MAECFQFKENGSCSFGDRCRFQHGDQPPGTGFAPRASRDNSCRQFAQTGTCSYGESCRFDHVGGAERDGGFSGGGGHSNRRQGGGDRSCRQFAQSGSCKFGEQCRFEHGTGASSATSYAPRTSQASQVCYAFQNGNCSYGARCRFSHAPSTTNEQEFPALA